MLIKAILLVTTLFTSFSMLMPLTAMAKEPLQKTSIEEYEYSKKSKSKINLASVVRALKRDNQYTPKMRALIKEALAFEKSLGKVTKLTPAIRKKLNTEAIRLARKYPKQVLILNKYIN